MSDAPTPWRDYHPDTLTLVAFGIMRDLDNATVVKAKAEVCRRLRAFERAKHALDACNEFLDSYADVRDSEDGPRPNEALSLQQQIEEVQGG